MGTLPSDILSYFSEIAERLWTGHASIIVGAGFSKNAINTINASKTPPDWGQLGDVLYEKLHNRKPDASVKYLNLLKLAEEFEAAFGRSTLEHFIQKNIADSEYEPSDIHKMLMELPWTDVFTTNYDTLLERSCKDVLSRKYDVVVNQNDLVYSNKPRIIKLHGSLPSERPFIITEEDYRVYPKKYAPFVNTVQQSLLENTLCLIGFSGDDPNFLKWIGWINDNFGYSNAPKIYLVGVLNLSESQKRLLSNKNIIAVDISNCETVKGNHKKGLELFIGYLKKQRNRLKNLEWPLNSDLENTPPKNEAVSLLIAQWTKCRDKYPNWIILPQEQREKLWIYTEAHSHNEAILQDLAPFEDLNYFYELNWRLEKCLFPIWNSMAPHFQRILDRYNFFPNEILENKEININAAIYKDQSIDWKAYTTKWVELSLAMLRFYREENFEEEWMKTFTSIYSIKLHLSYDQLAHFYYEQILNSIFKMQHEEAKKLLNEWPQNNNSLFWEAKRAMLLTEFGQLEEAANLLEFVLIEVRKRLNLSPIEDDYFWVSQEAYVMFQLKMVQQNILFGNWKIYDETNEKQDDFNERWNDLVRYKCDPWGESKYFDIILSQPYVSNDAVTIKNEFQIGRSTRSFKLGGSPKDFLTAYTFLRYLEELAIPLSLSGVNIGNKSINGALQRIISASPSWGIAISNRYRDNSTIEVVFDRQQLLKLPTTMVNKYVNEYLSRFQKLLSKRTTDPIAAAFTDKVPRILSRLCTKCSEETRVEILKFYEGLFKQQIPIKDLDKLFRNLVDSSNNNTIRKVVEILIDAPILASNSHLAETTFQEPFGFLVGHDFQGKLKIKQNSLNEIFQKASDISNVRVNAIKRLLFLYSTEQLNKRQIKKLFDILWQQKHKNGFPKDTNCYYFAFLRWPKPSDIDVESLYRQYIISNTFNIQGLRTEKGIGISGGEDRYASELLQGSKTINNLEGIKWSLEELQNLLEKCEEWWSLDKHYLTDEKYKAINFGGSIYEEFLARFKNLTNIIAMVFGFRREELPFKFRERIELLIRDMESYGISILKAKVVFGLYANHEEYLKELESLLALRSRTASVIDALESIILSVNNSPYGNKKNYILDLLSKLSIPLRWHITELSGDIFDVIKNLIENNDIDLTSIQEDIFSALNYILQTSSEKLQLAEYLILKQKSISLAGTIYRRCIKNNEPISDAILSWKNISESEDEFGDIRNRW